MRLRALAVCLVCFVAANLTALAGEYQQTRDGKTQVWNNDPRPGDVPTWSGDRDENGYATGFGTLTWYKQRGKDERDKGEMFARYFGKMTRGKLEGMVNVHSGNRTAHAIFNDGKRTGRWVAGPALTRNVPLPPEPKVATASVEPKPEARPTPPRLKPDEKVVTHANDVPAEGPPAKVNPPPPAASPPPSPAAKAREAKANPPSPSDRTPPPAPPAGEKKNKLDASLQALVGPPVSLRTTDKSAETNPQSSPPAPAPSNGPDAWLSKEDAIEMADKEAHGSGYDLNQFHRPRTTYDANQHTWSISYESKDPADTKHIDLTVDDRTKKVTIVSPQ